jgi:hypothetical protein
MTNKFCSYDGPALITLEGEIAFRFIAREINRTIYFVLGFDKAPLLIKIIDYRSVGLNAIDNVIQDEDDSDFAQAFVNPAHVVITESQNEVILELSDICDDTAKIENMLWITTCIEEPIPDYNYLFYRLRPFTDTKFSLVAIFNYQKFHPFFDGQSVQELLQTQTELFF